MTAASPIEPLAHVRAINVQAAFNRWCGIEVAKADRGSVELVVPWREEFGQYAGFMHAGIVGALIDTACGFAAATMVGRVLAVHYGVNFLRPAVGEHFVARARVVKPGNAIVYTSCELFGSTDGVEKLVATGETVLSVIVPKADAVG